jgi:hypothetical protein
LLHFLSKSTATGQFYAVSPTTLFQINPITGGATLIGQTTFDVRKAIGFDLAGNLYGTGIVDMQHMLISINKASAEAEVVGLADAKLEDIAIRPENGLMYGLGYGGDPAAYSFYQIDLTTGSLKDIGPSLGRPGGLAFTGIPEPTTFALLMLAIIGLAFHRRLKKTILLG